MKWTLIGAALLGLYASCNVQAAVDCQAVRARFHCETEARYPLHLSFDDGPALQTQAVLDVLQREQIPATFFLIAEKVDCERIRQTQCAPEAGQACPALQECQLRQQIALRARQEGHTLGAHSYQHLHYSQVEPHLMQQHFSLAKTVLKPYLNTEPPVFRLPYGDGWFNRKERPDILKTLEQIGFSHTAWDMSAFDWDEKNQQGDKILANVMEQMCSRRRGGIVLLHDGVPEQMHQGRLFTISHLQEWIPSLRCVADFKPLNFFQQQLQQRP